MDAETRRFGDSVRGWIAGFPCTPVYVSNSGYDAVRCHFVWNGSKTRGELPGGAGNVPELRANSDLRGPVRRILGIYGPGAYPGAGTIRVGHQPGPHVLYRCASGDVEVTKHDYPQPGQIGRAACREREEISVV